MSFSDFTSRNILTIAIRKHLEEEITHVRSPILRNKYDKQKIKKKTIKRIDEKQKDKGENKDQDRKGNYVLPYGSTATNCVGRVQKVWN